MRDNTQFQIQAAITHLSVYRQEIDTAILALEALLGRADMIVPPVAVPRTTPAKATRTKATATTTPRRHGAFPTATPAASTDDMPDTSESPDMPESRDTDRAKPGEWQARALRALAMGPSDVQVRELVTRLRVKDKDRDAANTRLWAALQALVKTGQVIKAGPRYTLARKVEAA
jgi:hypothetical protein